MLVLTRKIDEAIVIDDTVTIRVLEVKNGQVRLGIEAPRKVAIHREEVYLRILEENKRAAQEAPADLSGLTSIFKAKQ
jgi:carbon storage regulator